jgi:uncharacterized protein YunC (DUF1805 family)
LDDNDVRRLPYKTLDHGRGLSFNRTRIRIQREMSMITKEVKIGDDVFTGYVIELFKAPLILVKAKSGYIMCGLLDIRTAEKLGDAAAVVRGVNSVEEILQKQTSDVSPKGLEKGVTSGMTGLQALKLMNQ